MRWKRYALCMAGGMLVLGLGLAEPVWAQDTDAVTTDEGSILDTEEWNGQAAANVSSCANIRAEASTESEAVGVLLPGHAAEVLAEEGDWCRISSNGIEGYIRRDLLVFGAEAMQHYRNVCGITGTVTASALRVRREPSLSGETIGLLPQGNTVTIAGECGEWYEISYSGGAAYLYGDYVELNRETAGAISMADYQGQLAREEAARQEAQAASAQTAAGDGELAMLAAIIECEAGGESYTGKVAVGAVVLNRVRSASFPNSISEVIRQNGQFSPVSSGIFQSVLARGARGDCYEAAQAALAGENPVGGCLYFNSGSGRGIQIGNQHFY